MYKPPNMAPQLYISSITNLQAAQDTWTHPSTLETYEPETQTTLQGVYLAILYPASRAKRQHCSRHVGSSWGRYGVKNRIFHTTLPLLTMEQKPFSGSKERPLHPTPHTGHTQLAAHLKRPIPQRTTSSACGRHYCRVHTPTCQSAQCSGK